MAKTGFAIEGFVQAILEEPGEDGHWLILADFFEEHGDPPRAELIRALVGLDRLEREFGRFARPVAPEYLEQARLREALLAENGLRWENQLPSVRPARRAWRFREPFGRCLTRPVEVIRLEAFLKKMPWAMVAEPVRSISFPPSCAMLVPLVVAFARREPVGYLTEIRFEGDLNAGSEAVRILLDSPHLTRLEHLAVCGQTFPLPVVNALIRSEGAKTLRGLELRYDRLSQPELEELVCWPRLEGLDRFDLYGNRLNDRALLGLLHAQPRLQPIHLSLGGNRFGPEAVEAMARTAIVHRLTTLDLRRNRLGDDGVEPLVGCRSLAGLIALDLSDNDLGDHGAAALADRPAWRHLRALSLIGNRVGNLGAAELANSAELADLHALYLDGNRIGDDGAAALSGSPILGELRELTLSGNRIGDAGAVALASAEHLDVLRYLDLGDNPIGPRGRQALTRRFGRRVSLDG